MESGRRQCLMDVGQNVTLNKPYPVKMSCLNWIDLKLNGATFFKRLDGTSGLLIMSFFLKCITTEFILSCHDILSYLTYVY